jgi:tetratricopeptide (TPR) repeat protein
MNDSVLAISCAEKALNVYKSIFGEDHIFSGTALNDLGTIYSSISEFDKSNYYLEKAHEITIKHNGLMSYTSATSFNNLAFVKLELGQFDEAIANFSFNKKIKSKILSENHISIAHINFSIGKTYEKKGDLVNAIKSIKLAMKVYTKNQALIYQAKCNDCLGDFYVIRKDEKNALKYYQRALKMCNEQLGVNHMRSISIKNKISIIEIK